MANVAKDLGIPKQVAFLDKLNLLNKMDFELPELTSPVYDKAWNEYTSASVGYGYGLAVTMLHVVTAVNAIVNDGLYIYPTLLKRKPEEILKSFQVVSSKTSKRIRELMRKVITDGTGYMANMKNIQVGGKTGTAKKNLSWGGYERDKFKTYFVSVFPINDPKYTMLIMLDEAVNKGCTSSACTTVPISAKIIDEITPVLNLDLKIGL